MSFENTRAAWLARVAGLIAAGLLVAVPTSASAAEPEKGDTAAEKHEGGYVGEIVAIDVEHGAIVIDVKLAKDVLRVGATVTANTRFYAAGKRVELGALRVGQTMRLAVRRVDNGLEALWGRVLPTRVRPPAS